MRPLPWAAGTVPLMLAPMQGITNRALRSLFIEWVRPDAVFTEFVRVRPGSRKSIADSDRLEATADKPEDPPLVVQLIGRDIAALVAAVNTLQDIGVRHINLNMGCPFGRMTPGSSGGSLLRYPETLRPLLTSLRRAVTGSLSVKIRSGYDHADQIHQLLPLFEEAGTDFLILHPRLVVQGYSGAADHTLTTRVVKETTIPVIANGDIFDAPTGWQVLEMTGAAGLMLGRGAISDPYIFEKIRRKAPPWEDRNIRKIHLQRYLLELLLRYRHLFCGDLQVLCKMKEVLRHIRDQDFEDAIREMKRAKSLARLTDLLEELA